MLRPLTALPALILVALATCVAASAQVAGPARAASDWRDWPVTPGTWAYRQDSRGSIALFGRPGEDADLTIRCDRGRGQIYLSRRGDSPAPGSTPLTIRTTSMARTLGALPTGATPSYLAIAFGVRDPLLDAMGFSRGHFTVEAASMPALVIPAWAEVLRVVEDCRA